MIINFCKNKFYLFNLIVGLLLITTIAVFFIIQLQVDNLREQIIDTDNKITNFEERIQILDVEWAYLTRPARIRELSSLYLQNNSSIVAKQIKDINQIADYQKEQNFAKANDNINSAKSF